MIESFANDCDWPDDMERYTCICHNCKRTFMGNKRRVTCRVCATKAPEPGDAYTLEQGIAASSSCPVCGDNSPHPHDWREVENWVTGLVAAWGYRAYIAWDSMNDAPHRYACKEFKRTGSDQYTQYYNSMQSAPDGEYVEFAEHERIVAKILAAKSTELWCLHIHGPDDVYPAPSKAHAEKAAELFNKRFAHVTDVLCKAVVCEWPHSAESHAADVGTFCERCLIPIATPKAAAVDSAEDEQVTFHNPAPFASAPIVGGISKTMYVGCSESTGDVSMHPEVRALAGTATQAPEPCAGKGELPPCEWYGHRMGEHSFVIVEGGVRCTKCKHEFSLNLSTPPAAAPVEPGAKHWREALAQHCYGPSAIPWVEAKAYELAAKERDCGN
jgi:hypothetical protein